MSKLDVKDTTTSVKSNESLCEPSKLQGKVPLHPKQDWDQRQTSAQKRLKPENEEDSDDSTFEAPPKKISFGISQKSSQPAAKHANKIGFGGFKMGLQKTVPKTSVTSTVFEGGLTSEKKFQSKPKVAAAFGDDDDDEEEEEMPAEAKMRMKNIGRDTPTSAGPNSYGKSRMGFCDSKNIYERKLKEGQEKQRSD